MRDFFSKLLFFVGWMNGGVGSGEMDDGMVGNLKEIRDEKGSGWHRRNHIYRES